MRYSSVKPTKAVILAREPAIARATAPPFRAGDWEAHAPALLRVANRPLLGHALDWLGQAGIREAAIVTGHRLATEAREALTGGPRWRFEPHWYLHGPGERLGDSLAALSGFLEGEPFVLHLADSLARRSLPKVLGDARPGEREALIVVHGPQDDQASVVDIRERLGSARGTTPPELGRCATAGVAVLGAKVVEEAHEDLDAWPGRELDVLAERLTENGGAVQVCHAASWWRFGRSAEAALDGNRFALGNLREAPLRGEIIDSRIQGAVTIHPTARVESSIVRGPVVIGAGVRLRDAYVGPYTSIGDDVVIEGAEVEHSIVMPEASIRHLGGRLEASVVGPQARVFRDFRLPRALRLSIGQGAQVSLP